MSTKTILKSTTAVDGKILSKIILGTHTFGSKLPDEQSFELMDMYVQAGGNVIDTAACYGDGASEKCIGRWMNLRKNRKELVLCTKCGNPEFKDGVFARHRINPTEMREDLERSIENLQTDRIDIYFLHKDDPTVPVEEIIDFLNGYIKKGVIGHIGASNWTTQRIEAANRYAAGQGLAGFEFSELAFSLKENSTEGWGVNERVLEMEREAYAWYLRSGIPVFGYNPQAYGFFYKNFTLPETEMGGTQTDKNSLKKLAEICEKYSINVQQALFGAYFGLELNNFPVVTTTKKDHLLQLIDNCDTVLDRRDAEYIFKGRVY